MTTGNLAENPPNQNARIGLLMAGGVLAAAQIGKAIISIPLIRPEFALGLDLAGLLVGIFAIMGASLGIGAGVFVQQLGARRSLVGGMALIAIGNFLGAVAPNERVLLAARIVEGVGFLAVVLTVPGLLATSVDRQHRGFVMALWSAYMPVGIALMMMLAPLLSIIGWRPLWLMSAIISSLFALAFAAMVPSGKADQRRERRWIEDVAAVVKNPTCVILAAAFFAFSCQIFSMMFALPLVLTSMHGMSVGKAGLLSSVMLLLSAVGNVSSSLLLRAGVPVWASIMAAFLVFGCACFVVFAATAPLPAIVLSAALALGVGGLAPGALYAAAPEAAPSERHLPSVIGMLQQASNLGQLTGPFALGLWAQHFGWKDAPSIVAPAAAAGLIIAFIIRGMVEARRQKFKTVDPH